MNSHGEERHGMGQHHYRGLGLMAALSFAAMYILMYAMVDTTSHVYMNFNQVYMAGLMTAPMMVIELFVMRGMYPDGRRNALIIAVSVVAGIAMFVLIRQQTAISDRQFLRSMIPHHSGAILMCQDASLKDPDIRELCKGIISGQQAEIDQMTAKLRALDSRQ
jgi:uncharacterized protein (DUF305 family)